MRVNIYYGGRGLIDDPTLFVLEKITKVLDELRVTVERYNLYEDNWEDENETYISYVIGESIGKTLSGAATGAIIGCFIGGPLLGAGIGIATAFIQNKLKDTVNEC